MKQIYLIVYLESKGCKEVRLSKKGYYVMKNPQNGKISGVPQPSSGEFLKEETVCNICNALDIEVPPATQEGLHEVMSQLKEDVENRINGGSI